MGIETTDIGKVDTFDTPEGWNDFEDGNALCTELGDVTRIPDAYNDNESDTDDNSPGDTSYYTDTDAQESETDSEVDVPTAVKFKRETIKRNYKKILTIEDDFMS